MSIKSTNGFKDSKQFQNLSLDEIRNLINEEKEELKKDYKELRERRKLIKKYKKLTQYREIVRQGIDIKKEMKLPKPKPPPKKVSISEKKKVKSFDDYFEECIRNRKIPKDTPPYFREALERVILEYDQGLEKKNQLLRILLLSILFKEFLVLLQLIFLSE